MVYVSHFMFYSDFPHFQAAAALLFSQFLLHGVAVEVQPEEMLSAALAEFTDLAQVCDEFNDLSI